MAKKVEDNLLNEIDAFIEEEKKPKRKRRTKKEIEAEKLEKKEEPVIEEVKPKKRGRKKKEVVEVSIEDSIEDNRVVEETAPVPMVEEEVEEVITEEAKEETKEIKVVEDEDDDLYLTQSFKPLKKKKRLKRSIVKFLKTLVILGIIGLVGWIVGSKLYGIYLDTKPVNLYKKVILETGKKVNSVINSIPIKDNYIFEMQFDSNMKSYDYLNGISVGYGYLIEEDNYEDYIYYIDGNYERNGIHTLVKNDKAYKKYDISDVVFNSKLEESKVRDLIEDLTLNIDLINDVIEGNSKVISNILEEDDIEVSDEELEVNGTTINVRCNSIVLSDSLVERYLDELYKDKVLVNKMSKLFNKENDVLRRYLNDKISKYVDEINFNLYVTDRYEFVGFDYELDGFRDMYYYQYNGSYDVNIKLNKYINRLLDVLDIKIDSKANLGIDVIDKDVDVSVNSDNKFNLVFKELEKNVINFQYKNSDSTVSMDIIIKKDNIVIEYKNDNGKYMDVDIHLFDYDKVIDTRDVTSSSKKINDANEKFNDEIKISQKKAINLIKDFIYGN